MCAPPPLPPPKSGECPSNADECPHALKFCYQVWLMISIWHQIVNKLGVRAPQNNKDFNFINHGVLHLSLNRWLSYRTDKLVTDRQADRHTHHAGNNTQRPKLALSKNCIFKYRSPRGQWVNFHLPGICPHPPWGRLHHCISQKTVRIQEQCVDMDHTYKISKCTWYQTS